MREAQQPQPTAGLPLGLNPFCAYAGCRHRAAYQVGVMMTARNFNTKQKIDIPYMTTLTICDEHKGIPKPGDILTKQARAHLAEQMPVAVLDFNTAKIVLKAIESSK